MVLKPKSDAPMRLCSQRKEKRLFSQKKSACAGSAQQAVVLALLHALEWAEFKKIEQVNWITDSEYCYNAVTEHLDVWREKWICNNI